MPIFNIISVSKCRKMRDYIIMGKNISYCNKRRKGLNACFLGIKGSKRGL